MQTPFSWVNPLFWFSLSFLPSTAVPFLTTLTSCVCHSTIPIPCARSPRQDAILNAYLFAASSPLLNTSPPPFEVIEPPDNNATDIQAQSLCGDLQEEDDFVFPDAADLVKYSEGRDVHE